TVDSHLPQMILVILVLGTFTMGDLYDSLECHNHHGHCRRICFHNERSIGTCTNRRQLCCK
uniref:Beta-defensin-like domain-containing protein n=1 Tax=Varanus komodoensis TaxID=61221 RepID=A0A8D2JFT7_VARKO